MCLLRSCTLPRLGHLVRCHNPTASASGAHRFDEILSAALFACCGVDSISPSLVSDMVRIPVREGGLGFRSLAEVAPEAYAASLDPASNDQTTRTKLIDDQHMLRVDADDYFCALRKENKKRGASLWLASPSEEQPFLWPSSSFGLAVGIRCGVTGCGTKTHASCDGCKGSFALQGGAWLHHVLGCARRKGWTCNSRHREVNDCAVQFARTQGLPVLSSPTVGTDATGADRAADLRVELQDGSLLGDWSIFSPLARSAPTVRSVSQKKKRTYASVTADGAPLTVTVNTLACSLLGGLSRVSQSFLARVSLACSVEKSVLRTLIVKTIMRSNGLILAEAKTKAGLCPPVATICCHDGDVSSSSADE